MNNQAMFAYQFPSIDMKRTGENIVRLRKQSGYTVAQLKEVFGFSTPQAIYKWQNGLSLPSTDNLVVLSMIFHTSIDSILVLEEVRDVVFLYMINFWQEFFIHV